MRTNYTVICDTSTNHLWTLEASVSSFQYRFTTVGERSFIAEFANNVSFFRRMFPLTVMKGTLTCVLPYRVQNKITDLVGQ